MEPRPAATVIVARPDDGGVEVLAIRRGADSRFAPGFVVFPGGVVDQEDAALAARLFGDRNEAPRACALRELYEETGLLIGVDGVTAPRGHPPFADLRFDPPRPEVLVEVARWVAPEFLEVRFDARFYATPAPPGVEPAADGAEVDAAWWARPGDALEAGRRGDFPLMWPTLVTLHALTDCRGVDDVLALRVRQVLRR